MDGKETKEKEEKEDKEAQKEMMADVHALFRRCQ